MQMIVVGMISWMTMHHATSAGGVANRKANSSSKTDTIFSSQVFHSQETSDVQQNHSLCQLGVMAVVEAAVAS